MIDGVVVILAGGRSLRMGGASSTPKPIVQVCQKPLIIHVINLYRDQRLKNFVICLGFYAETVFRVISHYLQAFEVGWKVLEKKKNEMHVLMQNERTGESITFLFLSKDLNTGSRLLSALPFVPADNFFATYCDGITDVNPALVMEMHLKNDFAATLLGVRPEVPFGVLKLDESGQRVLDFEEKPKANFFINGGFFAFNKKDLEQLSNNLKPALSLEQDILSLFASEKKLGVYCFDGFWKCVDTPKNIEELEGHLLCKK